MTKDERRALAQDTLKILERGSYDAPGGAPVTLDVLLQHSVDATEYYGPGKAVHIEVTDETTLQAARRLQWLYGHVGVLNFASAKNPGGGFLRGTMAQEESLAYASGLYSSLASMKAVEYYAVHQAAQDPHYSDRMVWTPACPVFRDDTGQLLPEPYLIDVLTAAAPNVRALKDQDNYDAEKVPTLLERRIRRVLHIFLEHRCRVLVLGAWGCGVFGNDPTEVASLFASCLSPDGAFHGCFDHVCFAVYGDQKNLRAFQLCLEY